MLQCHHYLLYDCQKSSPCSKNCKFDRTGSDIILNPVNAITPPYILSPSSIDKQIAIQYPVTRGPSAFAPPAPTPPSPFMLDRICLRTVQLVATVIAEKKADWNIFVIPINNAKYIVTPNTELKWAIAYAQGINEIGTMLSQQPNERDAYRPNLSTIQV